MTTESKPARRRYHKGNVAEDLMAVAVRILETERVEDLSVRRLAREVGVTPANFYNHFVCLNDLLLDLAADAFEERRRTLAHITRTSRDRAEAVRRSVVSYVDLAIDRRQLFRIMFGYIPDALGHERYRKASDDAFAALVELVYGAPIYDGADLTRSRQTCKAAYGVFAMGYGLARVVVEGQVPFSPEQRAEMRRFIDSVIGAFIDGELPELLA